MNKLIYGDFLTEWRNNLEPKSVDLIVTDPPYFILNADWDKGEFEDFTTRWLSICQTVLKPGGTIWSFMGYDRHYDFHRLMSNHFIRDLDNDVVWARSKGRSSAKHLKSLREDIYYGYKRPQNREIPIWNEMKTLREVIAPYMVDGRPRGWFVDETGKRVRWTGLGNVWVYSAPNWSSKGDKQIHPTQKPVMLLERLIRLSSNEGGLVLDPFMGSGSTAIACKLSGRKYVGFEKTEKYYLESVDRISNFNQDDYSDFSKITDKKDSLFF